MKTEDSISQSWDDLVFENRNRDYGAYTIRKTYPVHVLEGLLAACLFGGLLFFYSQLVSLFPASSQVKPKEEGGIILNPPPVISIIEKVRTVLQHVSKPNTNVVPVITQKPIEEVDLPTVVDGGLSDPNANADDAQSTVGEIGPVTDEVAPVKSVPIVDLAEVMPTYEGGIAAMMKFVQRNMRYPHSAQMIGTEGTVYVQFVVNYEGKVVDVKVVRGISTNCDKEAARVIALMPDWKPGMQNRMPVSVRMVLPIKFRLEN